MRDRPPRVVRVGTILWSASIAALVIVLLGAIILPSTKRAHLDYRKLYGEEPKNSATEAPPTQPANGPATQP